MKNLTEIVTFPLKIPGKIDQSTVEEQQTITEIKVEPMEEEIEEITPDFVTWPEKEADDEDYTELNQSGTKDSKELKYECELCDEVFDCLRDKKRHREADHGGLSEFKCKKCPKTFETLVRLKRHINLCHTDKNLKCDKCDMVFKHANQLNVHIKMQHTEKNIKCQYCGKLFSMMNKLKRHIANVHETGHFACDLCDKVCASAAYLVTHKVQAKFFQNPFLLLAFYCNYTFPGVVFFFDLFCYLIQAL